ncbi:large conductance mechanosensitive channel protein MscL [Lancefieldella rimae]|uniref:large conductance mechanosensitive channel protein MscL n=1 Tax=Lancefieldella rimae TaxID=1383 RepID=UPI00288AC1EC|nr:large conductance mechanosensitive channel protein MscL [Lancefieldella rimae]
MKKLFAEFKDFIARGNVMDMAIGVIIGGAFMAIVNSLVNDIVNPFIKLISGGGTEVSGLSIPVAGTEHGIDFGSFISAIINFLIIAVIVFLLVKAINKFMKGKKESTDSPAQVCPHCLEEVKAGATRCPHCTGEIKSTAHTV